MKPTYVLFVPGSRGPSVYHPDLKSAREEASRLVASGVNEVMICRFIEGKRRTIEIKPLESNPLQPAPGDTIF